MHARRIAMTLGALVLSFALVGSASAAPSVEVTYDLSKSSTGEGGTLVWASSHDSRLSKEFMSNPVNIITNGLKGFDSKMKVVFSAGATTLDIATGSAIIESLQLAWSGDIYRATNNYGSITPRASFGGTVPVGVRQLASWGPNYFGPGLTFYGGVTLTLTTPVQGQLTAGGLLKATNANVFFLAQPKVNPAGTYEDNYPGVTQAINITVPVGSYGGKHWVDGRQKTATVTTVGGATAGGGYFTNGTGTLYNGSLAAPVHTFSTNQNSLGLGLPEQVTLVGREISREPIPEPGSLLLLGSGLAGLAALGGTGTVGHRLRRRRRS